MKYKLLYLKLRDYIIKFYKGVAL